MYSRCMEGCQRFPRYRERKMGKVYVREERMNGCGGFA
jgi:hypothetical protein